MTYHRRQRMEAFKRATFAAVLCDALPDGQPSDEADSTLGQDSGSTLNSAEWRLGAFASASVH